MLWYNITVMRRTAFATLALSVWIISSPQSSRQPSAGVVKKKSGTDTQLAANARDKQQASETVAINAILAAITKEEQERAKESQQEAADVQETVKAEWYLVYVGVAQTLALIGTLWAVWRQANKTADAAVATEKAARAAKENAEFLVNAEKAWVMLLPLGNVPLYMTTQNQLDWIPRLNLQFKNFGRTPAWIVEFACKFVLVEKDAPFDFGDSKAWDDGEPVPPSEKSMPFTQEFEEHRSLGGDDFIKIEFGSMELRFCGFIKYRDIFFEHTQTLRETYFGFKYFLMPGVQDPRPEYWLYMPHPEANKHT